MTSPSPETDVALEKPYRIEFEPRPGYLYVHISSDRISYRIARQYWDEIIEMLERTGSKRLLVDKEIKAELSSADAFQMASEVAKLEFQHVTLALCDRHATQKTIEFGEMVATNRGLHTKSFRDPDEAERWLLAQ